MYPEKVNAGRSGDNTNMRRIGQNVNPVSIKFSGKVGAEALPLLPGMPTAVPGCALPPLTSPHASWPAPFFHSGCLHMLHCEQARGWQLNRWNNVCCDFGIFCHPEAHLPACFVLPPPLQIPAEF